MRACLRAQDKRLSVLYGRLQEEAADDPIMSALYGRQQAHFQMVELAAKAARAERGHVRKQRQTRIMNAALDLGRNQQPFSRPIPEYVDPDAPPPAAAFPPASASMRSMSMTEMWQAAVKAKVKAAKVAKTAPKLPPVKQKKESTKLASLQYYRPGDKSKGVKGWMNELGARGWTKKKTAIVRPIDHWQNTTALTCI